MTQEARMNPDPLRPVDTDEYRPPLVPIVIPPSDDGYGISTPVVPLVIALGVIVGILIAWAVR